MTTRRELAQAYLDAANVADERRAALRDAESFSKQWRELLYGTVEGLWDETQLLRIARAIVKADEPLPLEKDDA